MKYLEKDLEATKVTEKYSLLEFHKKNLGNSLLEKVTFSCEKVQQDQLEELQVAIFEKYVV